MSRVRPQVRAHTLRLRRFYKDPSTIRMMLSYEFGPDEPLPTRKQIMEMTSSGGRHPLAIERGIT